MLSGEHVSPERAWRNLYVKLIIVTRETIEQKVSVDLADRQP